jgi:hypothetical protein
VSQARIAELATIGTKKKFWPISPDVAVEIKSDSDEFADTIAHAEHFYQRGSTYTVAIDPDTRERREFGTPPPGVDLDFDAIIVRISSGSPTLRAQRTPPPLRRRSITAPIEQGVGDALAPALNGQQRRPARQRGDLANRAAREGQDLVANAGSSSPERSASGSATSKLASSWHGTQSACKLETEVMAPKR